MSAETRLSDKIAAAIRAADGDHTMGAAALAEVALEVLVAENLLAVEVGEQRARNHEKWGEKSIEGMPPDYPGWLETLVEEVGEVARAKQTSDRERMRAELIDTLAVCWMWIDAIDEEPKEPEPRTFDERIAFEQAWDARVAAANARVAATKPPES